MKRRIFLKTCLAGIGAYAALVRDARAAGTSRVPRLKITAVKTARFRNMGNSFVRVYTDQGITGTGEMVNEVGAAEIINQSFSDIQPDMLKCGGLLETRKIAAMAEVYGIPIAPHGTATQLGKMAMSHICRHAHRHGEWRGGGRLGGSDVDQPRLDPPHAAEPHSLLPRGRRHVRQAANVDGQLAWRTQASHGHPSFSPDDRWVIYNSDAEKCDNVYMAEVHSL